MTRSGAQGGHTLIELVVAVAIAALLLGGLQQLLETGMSAMEVAGERTDLARRARFAMSRMVAAVAGSDRLLVPQADNAATDFDENIRVQTVPASPPQGSSTLATAVLAVTLNRARDLDGDGVFDADNDGDGRFDEDLPADAHNDGKPGIRDIDDDGDGVADFSLAPVGDDDESHDLSESEDAIDSVDNDGDGLVDEDPGADNNGDSAPGIAGVDDDLDGATDEGSPDDDDEDGQSDEDWLDPVVFYLKGTSLIERRAVPWDENGDGGVTGRDFVESNIADGVTLLRFERVEPAGVQEQLVDIALTLEGSTGDAIELNVRVRVGGWR